MVIAFATLAGFVFLVLPGLLVDGDEFTLASERLKAENDIRTTGVQLLAGFALGLGALFTAITLVYNREQQITERFTRAVEQLGHVSSDVRVGAVYALRRIMIDSPRDHDAIVDVLTAFVREHARPETEPHADGTVADERVRVEAQAALTVLGRRPSRPDRELDHLRLDDAFLPRAHLRAAVLPCVRLRHATLNGAHLEGADLEGARLRGARLFGADLERARLRYASLERACLDHATLRGATLDHASLVGAAMREAKLESASLVGAHLAGVAGEPELSDAQRAAAHCLPDSPRCGEAAKNRPPPGHPCVRFPWD